MAQLRQRHPETRHNAFFGRPVGSEGVMMVAVIVMPWRFAACGVEKTILPYTNVLIATIGALILAATAVDLLLTAFVEGLGPLSLRTGLFLARIMRFMVLRLRMRRILAWGGCFPYCCR